MLQPGRKRDRPLKKMAYEVRVLLSLSFNGLKELWSLLFDLLDLKKKKTLKYIQVWSTGML
jgi:hypothetical protein